MATVETAKDRRVLARDAGFRTTSIISGVAGVLAAFGLVAVVMAIAGAVGSELGVSTDGISTDEWRQTGVTGAVAAAAVLFLAFLFGGYTAGRMSRRAGLRHGLLVFVLGALVVAVVAGLAAWLADPASLREQLRDNGIPVEANTWSDIGIGAAIAAGAAMLVGSLLGGVWGDRWHGQLMRRAAERSGEAGYRPKHALGRDETTIDLRRDREPSVEEERQLQRDARADVGL